MRLINIKTLKLEEFLNDDTPPYAILSHTWGNIHEELTIRDVQGGKVDKPGVGSVKFRGCCRQAKGDGLEYIWIDTCCFDKHSSAELGEAIRSMFRYYKRASVCYAYLADVPSSDIPQESQSKFRSSRWFRSGWTLQELLAPESLQFYDSEWGSLGNKGGMSTIIGDITGIPQKILRGIVELDTASVAQRMSWISQRDTKRKEDLAYSLLGIFDVTMPILYGEGGDQAFFRLQDQIMKKTRDDSILAWGLSDGQQSISDSGKVTPGRILAAAPSAFANSGHIISRDQPTASRDPFEISGGSLRLYLPLLTTPAGNVIGLLNCGPEHDTKQVVGIPLAKVMSALPNEYLRPEGCYSASRRITEPSAPPTLIHIMNHIQSRNTTHQNKQYWLYNDHELAKSNLKLADVTPQSCWRPHKSMMITTISSSDLGSPRLLARLRHDDEGSQDFVIVLGLVYHGSRTSAECSVTICPRDISLEELAGKLQCVLMPKAFGKSSASNGLVHLHVKLVPDVRDPVFTITTEILSHSPSVTVNATAELQKSKLVTEIVQILRNKQQCAAETRYMASRLERVKVERGHAEDELRRLEERRQILVEKKDYAARQILILNNEQRRSEEIQGQLSDQLSHVWKQFNELYQSDENGNGYDLERMDGLTPLQWAVENGHVEMVELLLGEDTYTAAMTLSRWRSLSATSGKEYGDSLRYITPSTPTVMRTFQSLFRTTQNYL